MKTILIIIVAAILGIGGYFLFRGGPVAEMPINTPSSSEIKEITVIGKNFSFVPSVITVKSGDKVKINFQNEAGIPHNLTIEGLGIKTETFSEFTAPAPGTYTFYCSVPGHREAGMKGQLIVE